MHNIPMQREASRAVSTSLRYRDRKSTRLNSSHTVIYTLSLHDALPISHQELALRWVPTVAAYAQHTNAAGGQPCGQHEPALSRSEEHTSELQSHSDLHSFPTRRSSDLASRAGATLGADRSGICTTYQCSGRPAVRSARACAI